jgi:hypothetical protein
VSIQGRTTSLLSLDAPLNPLRTPTPSLPVLSLLASSPFLAALCSVLSPYLPPDLDPHPKQGEAGAKDAGKMRMEGKDYVCEDGDVLHFKFNKTT